MKKVVLAYSGGLDTSVICHMLASQGYEVYAVLVDLGQGEDLQPLADKAIRVGAQKAYVVDAVEEFLNEFVSPSIRSNAKYEGKYPLFTALSRPLIAKHLVRVAREVGADLVAHGSTGKGNDQVRFEVSVAALDPDIQVMAPVRDWKLTRDRAIEYAQKNEIPIPVTKKSPYSIDENIWGRSVECGPLENLMNEPPEDAYKLTCSHHLAPDEPEYITIGFSEGLPTSLNGEKLELRQIIERLTEIAGRHGIGRVDMIESRLVGIKSREIYEVPAAEVILVAHEDLESLTLERDTFHYKKKVEQDISELIYYGKWYSPLLESLFAFVERTQKPVTGEVTLKLYKGKAIPVKRSSPHSLYLEELATYEEKDQFSHEDARGFVNLWGLPLKIFSKVNRKED
ncbi:MAG: argininosuccinate synthase [Actinobacteria bacterium]|nr:argininosuccinate synthase [Actinomycetota bacterium]